MDEVVQWVKDILTSWGLSGLAKYAGLILFFIFGSGAGVLTALWKLIKKLVQFVKHRKVSRDLHPFFTAVEIKNHTQYYVPTKCQNIAPSKEDEPGRTHAFATKEKIIPFFLKKGLKYDSDDQRFYIILADSGMGKTTFMINLYIKYTCQWRGNKCAIKLMPMGFPDIDRELDKIVDKERENMILLLDAFDEDRLAVADYRKRMNEILNKTFRFRKIIITCRTQFFPSEEEEPGETGILKFGDPGGYHIFHKLYVSPFDEKDIKKYLGKRFSVFNFKKKSRALKIVKQSPNLMVRPMLLNYIDDLLKSSRKYEFTFQVYEELIKLWIERESRKYKRDEREGFKKELYKFSREIALDIYRDRETRKGLIIDAKEIEPFAQRHDIRLGDMEMKSRSLLNRNARGEYKFSHKSVLEYFLALEMRQNSEFEKTCSFEGMDQARSFYSEMWKEYTFKFLTRNNLKGEYRAKGQNKPKDLSKIKLNELESLEYLSLRNNNLTDISPLNELKELKGLYLGNNQLTDISQLKELKKLWSLDLNNVQLADISQLKELKGLEILYLDNNNLTDISPLKELKKLKDLRLSNTSLTDISPLKELKELKDLDLCRNQLTDISPLKELKKLKNLDLSHNQLSDISPLKELKELNGLGLSNNQLIDISPLKELQELKDLDLRNNQLTDISPLKELKGLRFLNIEGNPIPGDQSEALKKVLPKQEFTTRLFLR